MEKENDKKPDVTEQTEEPNDEEYDGISGEEQQEKLRELAEPPYPLSTPIQLLASSNRKPLSISLKMS